MQIGYDRYNAISTVQKLEAAGYECVEIKQHSSVLHMPTKYLKEKILQKKFRYDGNRLLEINFQNARCTEDTNLNKYVNKKKSTGKVDMVVALINAVYLLQQELLNYDDFWSTSRIGGERRAFWKKRAEPEEIEGQQTEVDAAILRAWLSGEEMNRGKAMNIPALSGCINKLLERWQQCLSDYTKKRKTESQKRKRMTGFDCLTMKPGIHWTPIR